VTVACAKSGSGCREQREPSSVSFASGCRYMRYEWFGPLARMQEHDEERTFRKSIEPSECSESSASVSGPEDRPAAVIITESIIVKGVSCALQED
jgi:hypothetical protein